MVIAQNDYLIKASPDKIMVNHINAGKIQNLYIIHVKHRLNTEYQIGTLGMQQNNGKGKTHHLLFSDEMRTLAPFIKLTCYQGARI